MRLEFFSKTKIITSSEFKHIRLNSSYRKNFSYNNDACVELILALTFSDSVPKSSIVFLTESDQFKRNYSNTHRALRDYYCKRDAKKEGIELIYAGENVERL